MNRHHLVSVICVAALSLGVATLRGGPVAKDGPAPGAGAGGPGKPADLRAALVGTWTLKSMKVDGEKNPLPDQGVTLKHVTPGGFTWLSYSKGTGQVFRAAGGTFALRGDEYTETIEYGVGQDFDAIKNASHPFKCRIEGDTWYHTGKLANGITIDEEWTRVKPAEGQKRP